MIKYFLFQNGIFIGRTAADVSANFKAVVLSDGFEDKDGIRYKEVTDAQFTSKTNKITLGGLGNVIIDPADEAADLKKDQTRQAQKNRSEELPNIQEIIEALLESNPSKLNKIKADFISAKVKFPDPP